MKRQLGGKKVEWLYNYIDGRWTVGEHTNCPALPDRHTYTHYYNTLTIGRRTDGREKAETDEETGR
jgi:hypothetical protein